MAVKEAGSRAKRRQEVMGREWEATVRDLCHDVRAWSEEQGWQVTESQKEMRDEGWGPYSLPMLTIERPDGKLFLEPIARLAYKAEGRVDLYSYPQMDRVMLMRVDGLWVPRIALGLTWPVAWGRECFFDLAQRLVSEP